jgi:copper chaperone
MEKRTLSIPNISCGHCVMAIEKELSALKGVSKVEGDVSSKEISVEFESPADMQKIRSTLKEINYPATEG